MIKDHEQQVVLDVCHNIDGIKAVYKQIKNKMPHITKVKMVMGIAKSKKLDKIVDYLEN